MSVPQILAQAVRSSRTAKLTLAAAGSAGSVQRFPQAGIRFYFVECDSDAEIAVKSDKTQAEIFTVGTGKEFTEEQAFTALEIQNLSAAAVTVTIFAGFGDYIDKRTTIVGNRLSSILPVIEPKTQGAAGATNPIGAGATINLTGVPVSPQLRRKCIVVTNLDPALNIQIRDNAGGILLTVFKETSVTLPISEAVQIHNPNGAAVSISYGEIWWMKP